MMKNLNGWMLAGAAAALAFALSLLGTGGLAGLLFWGCAVFFASAGFLKIFLRKK